MALVLIGATAAGKSTVGAAVAAALGVRFVDIDERIAHEAGRASADVILVDGEAAYRELERAATLAALDQAHGDEVIAATSGIVLDKDSTAALAGHDVVYLVVDARQITRRLGLNAVGSVPLGNVRARMIQLLAERDPLYRAAATRVVDTRELGLEQVVDRVIEARAV